MRCAVRKIRHFEKQDIGEKNVDKEKKKAEKDIEFYIRRQIMYQKIHMTLMLALLGVLVAFSVYFVNFAQKAKVFMDETKVTLEQANETMRIANLILEIAAEKLDNLDMESINNAIGKTDELLENVDEVMEKTNDVLTTIDGAAEKTNDVLTTIDGAAEKTEDMMDSVQDFSNTLDGLKGKMDTANNWLSKFR